MKVEKLIRPEIVSLQRYFVANGDNDSIKLHKNENPWPGCDYFAELELNRYPDPDAKELTNLIAKHYAVPIEQLFLSRGSDEAIDLLIRLFCRAEKDSILIFTPTFGIYEIYARINGAKIVTLPLQGDMFELNVDNLANDLLEGVKIIFICSPNNPTGNLISLSDIQKLCMRTKQEKIIVIDEAYMDFCDEDSALQLLEQFPNLIVLRTLSKAYGMAGARCGITFASSEIIHYLKKISAPYTLSSLSIYAAKKLFSPDAQENLHARLKLITNERDRLVKILSEHRKVQKIWPSVANFILMKLSASESFAQYCRQHNLLIRNLHQVSGLENCIRLTVGTAFENNRFLEMLELFDFDARI